jgi:hypothetical protein
VPVAIDEADAQPNLRRAELPLALKSPEPALHGNRPRIVVFGEWTERPAELNAGAGEV